MLALSVAILCVVACGPRPAASFHAAAGGRSFAATVGGRCAARSQAVRRTCTPVSQGDARGSKLGLRMASDDETAITRRDGLTRAALYILGAPAASAVVCARTAAAETSVSAVATPAVATKAGGAAIMSAEKVFCDQAVSRLVNANTAQEVYIVGTAHISAVSAELVRDTIRLVGPNKIMVELDSQRVKKRQAAAPADASAAAVPADTPPPSSLWDLVRAGMPLHYDTILHNDICMRVSPK